MLGLSSNRTLGPTIGPTTTPTTSPTSTPPENEDFEILWCDTLESSNGNLFNSRIRVANGCTSDVKLKDKSNKALSGDYSIEFKVKNCSPPMMTALVMNDDGSPFTSVRVTFWYSINKLNNSGFSKLRRAHACHAATCNAASCVGNSATSATLLWTGLLPITP